MITYDKFKEIFNKLDSSKESEIGIYFENKKKDYLIVKFPNYLTIGSFGCSKDEIYTFNNIDELYNTTIDNICLKDDWNSITDILIDLTFSVIDDKNIIKDLYQVSL